MIPFRRGLLVLLPVLGLAGCYPSGSSDPLVIGHLTSLSGPDKAAGEHAQHAIDLAVEEANKDDRRTARPVRVLHGDTHGDGETAQDQATRFLTVDRAVALLDDTDAAQFERVARAAQPYGVPLVTHTPLAGSPLNDYAFSTTAAPAYEGQVLARFAAEELKATSAAAVADARSPACTALAGAFLKELNKAGVDQAGELSYKGEADLGEVIGPIKKAPPKVVLFAGAPADLAKFRPQLHEAAPEAVLLFGGDEAAQAVLAEDRAAGGKLYLATVFAEEGLTPAGQELAKKYHERFGRDLDVHAALAYDGVRLLIKALRGARPLSGSQARRELTLIDEFDSLTGPLAFTKDHAARRPVFVVALEEGRPKLAKRYDPEPKPAAP
jgi:branched-chain amino acid transport system substrate-binding protein